MTSPQDETPRERLARLMNDRRAELRPRLRWSDVAEAAGLTTEGLRGIRFGTGEIRHLTKRGIEEALMWRRGSVDAILSGGEPTAAGEETVDPEPEIPTTIEGLAALVEKRSAEDRAYTDAKMKRVTELLRGVIGDEATEELLKDDDPPTSGNQYSDAAG